jgi:ABC-type transport system involved in multi-copper enzyme maturation permease subunit
VSTQTPAVPATAPLAAPPPGRAGFGHLLLSEWTKVRSVRSTVWSLGLFIVITVGLTVLFTWLTEANWSNGQNAGARAASVTADPVSFIMGAGAGLGQLVICVLGALLITTEYSTGVIRASLLAVPRRVPMLAAKAVVFTILILIVAEIVCVSSFLAGSAILSSKISVTMGDHGVARAVIGSGLYLTAIGLLAMAVGLLIRHTAGSIATIIGIVLVLPILSGLLPGSWGAHINAYLPEQAGTLIGQASRASGDLLGPWQGFGVLCLWVAVLMTIGIVLLKRRDA